MKQCSRLDSSFWTFPDTSDKKRIRWLAGGVYPRSWLFGEFHGTMVAIELPWLHAVSNMGSVVVMKKAT